MSESTDQCVAAAPQARRIDSWQTAELNARDWMRYWGFADADLTGSGADSGIDVRSSGAIAQVKREAIDVGRPVIQALVGARMSDTHLELLFFAASGYTAQAIEYADAMNVALFVYEPDGAMAPLNGAAHALLVRGQGDIDGRVAESVPGSLFPFGPNTERVMSFLAGLKDLTNDQWLTVLESALDSTTPDPDSAKAEKLLSRGVERLPREDLIFLREWTERASSRGLRGLMTALKKAYNASAVNGARTDEVRATSVREIAHAVEIDKSALGLDTAAGILAGEDMRQSAVNSAVSVTKSVALSASIATVDNVLAQFTHSSKGDLARMRAALLGTIAEAAGWTARALVVRDWINDAVFDSLVAPMRSAGIEP